MGDIEFDIIKTINSKTCFLKVLKIEFKGYFLQFSLISLLGRRTANIYLAFRSYTIYCRNAYGKKEPRMAMTNPQKTS